MTVMQAADGELRVAIIGAGFGGIAAAIRCAQRGIRDVVVFEAGDDVGGTWRDNTYPGAACDIPSHLYSLSFAPKGDWSRGYPTQPEIQAYLQEVADRSGLRHVLRTRTQVIAARFDEPTATWRVTTDQGDTVVADALISAVGPLRVPAYAPVPGRETFGGPQFHTARWDHEVELTGRRVGVIGTGASAIQVVPAIADRVGELRVFQRTPAWIIPRHDRAYQGWEQAVAQHVPGVREAKRAWVYLTKEGRIVGFRAGNPGMALVERTALGHLRRQVADPQLREQLTPNYRMGCKRVLISNDFYPAMTRDDVTLHTDPITRIGPGGVELAGGRSIDLDVLVHATGFAVDEMLNPMTIEGLDGRRLDLEWAERPVAYLGITAPGFPNMFSLLGPNTGLGHNSVVYMMESQLNHVMGALGHLRDPAIAYLDVKEDAASAFVAEMDRRHEAMVWSSGCRSWYLDEQGRNIALWPGSSLGYRWRTRRFDPDAYRVVGRAALPAREPVTLYG
jgi:cation diffusion facilitator CzcD-associated flavoprotein CzcO